MSFGLKYHFLFIKTVNNAYIFFLHFFKYIINYKICNKSFKLNTNIKSVVYGQDTVSRVNFKKNKR